MGYLSKRSPPLVWLLILALGTLGVAQAWWTQDLTVQGAVDTGKLEAKWVYASCEERQPWPGMENPGEPLPGVGSTTTQIDAVDLSLLHVTLSNAYPEYAVQCTVKYENTGSVPWTIRGFSIHQGQNLTNCTWDGGGGQDKSMECDQLDVVFEDGVGSTVTPGNKVSSTLLVHVDQGAAEDTTYAFTVKICVSQPNQDPVPGSCLNP